MEQVITDKLSVRRSPRGASHRSLPTVVIGVVHHTNLGGLVDRRDITETVAPMVPIRGRARGLLVNLVSAAALKLGLGAILIVPAIRIFHG